MWVKNLPTYVKAFISDQPFNKDTYQKVFDMADKVWLSHKQEIPAVAAIKAENTAALKDSTDVENPAVAAIRAQGNRGNGRGGRGNRGVRGGRGGGRGGNNQGGQAKKP